MGCSDLDHCSTKSLRGPSKDDIDQSIFFLTFNREKSSEELNHPTHLHRAEELCKTSKRPKQSSPKTAHAPVNHTL